jgi:hypothetical protein
MYKNPIRNGTIFCYEKNIQISKIILEKYWSQPTVWVQAQLLHFVRLATKVFQVIKTVHSKFIYTIIATK